MPEPPWTVARVEVVSAGLATPLRGRAWLLGTGVVAFCTAGPTLTAVLRISVVDERLHVTSVDVTSTSGPVTATVLRTIPVDRLVRAAFASLDADDWTAQRAVDASARLDEVVAVWRSLQGGHDSHRATQTTARRLSLSRGYVSRLLTRARDEGLIPGDRVHYGLMTFHETVPPVGARCGDDRCGQTIGQGHPRTGWIRVFVAGSRDSAVWFSSTECLVFAVGARPGLRRTTFVWPGDPRHGFTVPEAVDLLNRYSGYTMQRLGLTGVRVRYAHRLALAAVAPEHPDHETVRAALAAARGVLLAEVGENDLGPADREDDRTEAADEVDAY